MTHTPGPWRVMPPDQAINAWIVADAEGGSVADCSPPGPWMSPVEADDNARLAAAAPEMLVALRAVLTVWHDATATRQDDEAAESAARAAIAKAEGCSDAPAHDDLDGRRYLWRDLLALKRAQATQKAEQPALFELREDHRPPGERSASERYQAPSLFTLLDP